MSSPERLNQKCHPKHFKEFNLPKFITNQGRKMTVANKNSDLAFANYLMWLINYPNDYKGATEAASDFIENEGDLKVLESNIARTRTLAPCA